MEGRNKKRSCLSPSDKSVTRCHKKSANIERPCDKGIYGGNKIFQIYLGYMRCI